MFLHNAGTGSISNMPYIHYLRNHLGNLMVLYKDLFWLGIRLLFNEHLNKRLKFYELAETNLDQHRFYTIMHVIGTKQFHFTSCIMPSKKEITCTSCNQTGRNRKNKCCPLHPSHPQIEFNDTDTEELPIFYILHPQRIRCPTVWDIELPGFYCISVFVLRLANITS